MLQLALIIGLAAVPGALQESSSDVFPQASVEGGELSARFDESLALTISLDGFAITQLHSGDLSLQLCTRTTAALSIDNERATTRVKDWTVDGDSIAIRLHAAQGDKAFDLEEVVTAEHLEGAHGFQRRIEIIRATGWEAPDFWVGAPSLTLAPPVLSGANHRNRLLSHCGFSTVSDPGLTYEIWTYDGPNGARVWRFRSGYNDMTQGMNPGVDPRLQDVVLIDPEGRLGIDLGDVIAHYVEQPHDRRKLLELYTPERFAREYDRPFVRPDAEALAHGLAVRFDERVELHIALREFGMAEATISGLDLAPRTPQTHVFALNGKSAKAVVTGWKRNEGSVVFNLRITREEDKLRAHATITPVRVGSAVGYRREVRIVRPGGYLAPPWDEPTMVLTLTDPIRLKGCESPKWQIRHHYGHSTVSESGITYDVLTFRSATGHRVWLYRSYIAHLNQVINHHTEQRLVEVVLVDAVDGELELKDVLAALVTHAEDRRTLLAD